MPRKLGSRETEYYALVERFLKRRFGCFVTAQNKGTKFGRIDVIGVRDIGGDLSGAVEIIAVEVKAGNQPFNTATGQAYSYSVFAERCYLADLRDDRKPFALEEIDIASKLSVGLLAIRSSGRVDEILASPQHTPLVHMRAQLLDRLHFALCILCGSIFKTGDEGNWWARLSWPMKNALKKKRGLVVWFPEIDARKRNKTKIWERRFVCPECVEQVFGRIVAIK